MNLRLFYYLAIICILCSCTDNETKEAPLGSVQITILDEYRYPVSGATIKLLSRQTQTNSNGTCFFENVAVGKYTIKVSKANYLDDDYELTVLQNALTPYQFTIGAGTPYVKVDEALHETINIKDYYTIAIESNSAWRIENISESLKLSITQGRGPGRVEVQWDFNGLDGECDYWEGKFTVVSGSDSKFVTIRCYTPLKMVEIRGVYGNAEEKASNSGKIKFNKPVDIESVRSGTEMWIGEVSYKSVDNGYGIEFSCPQGSFGGEVPIAFSVTAKQNKNLAFRQTVQVPFYDKRLAMDGHIKQILLSRDERTCWVMTENPNTIHLLNIEDFTIVKTIELSFTPRRIAFNYYNNRLYALDYRNSTIYVLDKDSGSVLKSIVVEPDQYDHPQGPTNLPYDIIFTDNGYGIVLFGNHWGSGARWRLLDSRQDDKLLFHDDFPKGYDYDTSFSGLFLNHDRSKIITRQYNEDLSVYIFDGAIGAADHFRIHNKFHSSSMWAGGRLMEFVVNRAMDRIFVVAAPGSQVICDFSAGEQQYSEVSFLEGRGASADFGYRPEDNGQVVYYRDNLNYMFYVVDCSALAAIFATKSTYGLGPITSLMNGQEILSYINSWSDYTSHILSVKTSHFH